MKATGAWGGVIDPMTSLSVEPIDATAAYVRMGGDADLSEEEEVMEADEMRFVI